ncbi:DMT family transporter [Candidatus Clostridium radicumherbarum]|uniref:DMT family transporter n=1 Tax=Candidatus Clostridium radicumherbarum TaxID=3381662 RepID=A0ABW8TY93_9CLOT
MKKQFKADILLILITFFWGSSCLMTKIGLDEIQGFNLIALRFIIAFLLSASVFWKRFMTINVKTVKYAAILAGILSAVFVFMTFGVKYTTASNAGFLTCLAGVFIPLILFILLKQTPKINVVISICLAFLGICLLSLNQQLQFNKGDLLCILCSLAFAVHIIATGILTRGVDSVSLGVLQLGFVGVYSMIFSFIFENPKLPSTNQFWFTVLALSIFCTAIAFIVQTVAQKDTTSTHTGLIFSLEPVFAAILAFIFAGEILSIRGYLGAVILIISILLVEFDFKYKFNNLKDVNCS